MLVNAVVPDRQMERTHEWIGTSTRSSIANLPTRSKESGVNEMSSAPQPYISQLSQTLGHVPGAGWHPQLSILAFSKDPIDASKCRGLQRYPEANTRRLDWRATRHGPSPLSPAPSMAGVSYRCQNRPPRHSAHDFIGIVRFEQRCFSCRPLSRSSLAGALLSSGTCIAPTTAMHRSQSNETGLGHYLTAHYGVHTSDGPSISLPAAASFAGWLHWWCAECAECRSGISFHTPPAIRSGTQPSALYHGYSSWYPAHVFAPSTSYPVDSGA